MSKPEIYDARGNRIAGSLVPDGGKLRIPMLLMDGGPADVAAVTRAALADASNGTGVAVMHRPGFATILSDQDRDKREAILDARDRRKQDAWKLTPVVAAKTIAPPLADVDAAARRDARIRDAWKGAA